MHDRILARELGVLSPRDFAKSVTADLLGDFAAAPHHRFDGVSGDAAGRASAAGRPHETSIVAHRGGANALAIEKYEGRL
jgi:DNA excision repair protein ERCC-8